MTSRWRGVQSTPDARDTVPVAMPETNDGFKRVYSGAPWEKTVGYCRALRAGDHVYVTGTAPVADDGSVYGVGDPFAQAERCFVLIERALNELGADKRAVVRTRMYVTAVQHWEAYGRAHAEFFAGHHPATTMVEVKGLIDPAMMIEVEVDAYVGSG
ncbi:MAG: RidA family protein [Myxococcota bacterium]